jgi:hypothetical protein
MKTNRSDIVAQLVQEQVNEFLDEIGEKVFPIRFELNEHSSFSFRVEAAGDPFQVMIALDQVKAGDFVLSMQTCFRTEDKVKDKFRIDGVPLGVAVVTQAALTEVESEDDLYSKAYNYIRNNLGDHLQKTLF